MVTFYTEQEVINFGTPLYIPRPMTMEEAEEAVVEIKKAVKERFGEEGVEVIWLKSEDDWIYHAYWSRKPDAIYVLAYHSYGCACLILSGPAKEKAKNI